MSDNGHALGAAVNRLSLPIVVSIIAVAIAFIGLAGTAIGTLVVSTRDDTETIAALKAKNDLQDQRIDTIVRDVAIVSSSTQAERSEVRQSLASIGDNLSKLVTDVRVIAERQNALGPRHTR